MQTIYDTIQGIKHSYFFTARGVQESFITAAASSGLSFEAAADELADKYSAVLLENALDETTLQFTRFYLSDITNDYNVLLKARIFQLVSGGAVSFVQQRPLGGGQLGMLVYHIKSECGSFRQAFYRHRSAYGSQKVCATGKNYSLLWTTGFTDSAAPDSEIQTQNIFSELSSTLRDCRMTLRRNTVRTWIYVRDIDNNYAGMVKARRELFDKIDLTSKTRYIASTGIEGKAADPHCLLTLDALSIGNINEEQIIRMEAEENLSSTSVYGVTFERGLRIRFGDRSHLYISGTASIDNKGNILHEGDVCRQLERTIDNIEALLSPHNATLNDMQYFILYLRNPLHFPLITDILSRRIPEGIPLLAVEGAVCRPGWLVEIEGVGITPDNNDFPEFL
jgi:enamine deaminase RidA (YjgF/YER057c/UK114 family)